MSRKVPVPKVTYRQMEITDSVSINAAFDHIFELVIKSQAKKKSLHVKSKRL